MIFFKLAYCSPIQYPICSEYEGLPKTDDLIFWNMVLRFPPQNSYYRYLYWTPQSSTGWQIWTMMLEFTLLVAQL